MTTTQIASISVLLLATVTACRAEVQVLGGDTGGGGKSQSSSGQGGQGPSDPACDYSILRVGSWQPSDDLFVAGQCLDQPPMLTPSGDVDCFMLDLAETGGACHCDPAEGYAPLTTDLTAMLEKVKENPKAGNWDCPCQIQQISGNPEDVATCENDNESFHLLDSNGQPLNGFCYIDPGLTPPRGNPEIVKDCPAYEQRLLRIVGAPTTGPKASLLTRVTVCRLASCGSPQ